MRSHLSQLCDSKSQVLAVSTQNALMAALLHIPFDFSFYDFWLLLCGFLGDLWRNKGSVACGGIAPHNNLLKLYQPNVLCRANKLVRKRFFRYFWDFYPVSCQWSIVVVVKRVETPQLVSFYESAFMNHRKCFVPSNNPDFSHAYPFSYV